MDKILSRIPIPASLLKLFVPEAAVDHVSYEKEESGQFNQDLDARYILSETLFAIVTNTQKLFEEDYKFVDLKKLAKEVENISDANDILIKLSNLIESLSNDYDKRQLSAIYEIPGKIIENYEFPEAYIKQSDLLKKECKNINDSSEYKSSIYNVFNLIDSVCKDSIVQKKELEKFLVNIGIQISRIGEELNNFVSEQSTDVKLHNDLNTQMHNAVSSLSESLLKSDDLNTLKDTVKAQLDTLQNIVAEERKVVKKHELSIKENMNNLANKVNELKQETQELKVKVKIEKENALKDPLTGLFNREAYDNKIKTFISEAKDNKTALSLLVWDIDHFKKFNDTYGHVIGDKVLKAVTKKLSHAPKDNYFLARYGGEEFVMLLPDVGADEALRYANDLRDEVSRITYLYKGKPLKVTISCGISVTQGGSNAKNLFVRADKALYDAKMSGRNCVKLEANI